MPGSQQYSTDIEHDMPRPSPAIAGANYLQSPSKRSGELSDWPLNESTIVLKQSMSQWFSTTSVAVKPLFDHQVNAVLFKFALKRIMIEECTESS